MRRASFRVRERSFEAIRTARRSGRPAPARLTLADELRLTREVEMAEAAMVEALVCAPTALLELAVIGAAIRGGAVRPREVSRIAEHVPAAASMNRGRLIDVLKRAGELAREPAPDAARRALASDIVSLRLQPDVLERAAAMLGDADADARLAFGRALRSSRAAKAEWAAGSAYLVFAIARRYRRRGVDTIDLVQDGNIGLLRAVEKFDSSLGHRFHVYAAWWIRQHIFRALADYGRSIRVPLPVVEAGHRLRRARRVFEGIHGREPDAQEIVALSGLDPHAIALADAITDEPISLHFGEPGAEIVDRLTDRSAVAPDEQVARARLHAQVRVLFDALTPSERDVLRLRFGLDGAEEHTLVEVAATLCLSRDRARRLEERALSKLRLSSLREGLEAFLAA